MSQVRVHNFSGSLDGFGTGEGQSLDAPFGHAGGGHEPSLRSSAGLPCMLALSDDRQGRHLGGHRPVAVLRPQPRCFGGQRVVKPPGSAIECVE